MADLVSRRFQSLQILLVIAASTMTFTMGVALYRSATILWDRIAEVTNSEHLLFLARNLELDWGRVQREPGVAETAGPFPILRGPRLSEDPAKTEVMIYGAAAEPPRVGRPLITEGRWISGFGEDQIVLDSSYARALRVGVGGQVEFITPRGKERFNVVGLAINPTWPYPQGSAAVYVPRAAISRLEPDQSQWLTAFAVRMSDPTQSDELAERVTAAFPPGAIVAQREWQRVRDALLFNNNVNIGIVRVFALLALIAVGLIVANTTSAFVLARYREIGLMKAIGFTPSQVALLLLAEHLGLGLVGGVLGILAGLAVAPSLLSSGFLRSTSELLQLNWSITVEPWTQLLVLAWIELVVALFTLLPAVRGGRIATVEAIRVGAGPIWPHASRLARLATFLHQPPVVVLGVKDAFARPWRAFFAISSLMLTIGLATVGLAGEATFRSYIERPATSGQLPSSLTVRRGLVSHAETMRILRDQPEITRVYAVVPVEVQSVDDPGLPITTRAVESDALPELLMMEGRAFQGPDEAIVAQGVLDRLHLQVGDELRLSSRGRPLSVRIVGRYYTPENFGQIVMFSLDTVRRQVAPSLEATEYLLTLQSGADRDAAQRALLRASQDQFGVVPTELPEELRRIRTTFATLGVVLLLIAVINLLNTALLGVRERVRELGILKAVGLTPAQVVASVVVGISVQTLVAAAIGMPLGAGIATGIYTWVTRAAGGGAGVPVPADWVQVGLVVTLASLAVAVLSSAIPAYQAARLQVAEALRHE
jgi:putative ABC transport system permease protein